MSRALKFLIKSLIVGVGVTWFLVGLLLTPQVRDIMLKHPVVFGTGGCPPLDFFKAVRLIRGFIFIAILPALLIVVVFVGKVRDAFDRLVSGALLIFQTFPTIACTLQPGLYLMCFPTGIYILLASPCNPFYLIPEARWLVQQRILLPRWLANPSVIFGGDFYVWDESYLFVGVFLFLMGLGLFVMSLIQLRGKRLVTSGLYSIVRHPQYLGLILTTLGLSLILTWRHFGFWGGLFLFLVGLSVFATALVQQLRGKRLVTSGLYSIVRHPQYLGLILTTLGFSLINGEPRPISFVAWITLIFGYILLADKEEADLQIQYGEKSLSYKKRVPFILPLFPSGTLEPWMPTSKLGRYTLLLCIYLLTTTLTIIILRAY